MSQNDDREIDINELTYMVSVCLDKIEELTAENVALKNEINSLKDKHSSMFDWCNKNFMALDRKYFCISSNVKYEVLDNRMDLGKLLFPKFYEIDETIDLIVNEHCSMGRFGDGEFSLMIGQKRQSFQLPDNRLMERLRDVMQSDEEEFLVAIADNYGNLDKYNEETKTGIRAYMTAEVRNEHAMFINPDRKYHNTYITRPYVIYADNKTDAPRRRFDALKRIWDRRNVIIVEGCQSRLGVGNDLFSNVSKIERIEAPATNSFDRYDELLEASLRYGKADTLFLIALGPTAGVLAYDLCKAGFQAIDVGHVDLEYEWFLRGKGVRCEVKGKYNNEFAGGNIVEDVYDAVYESQIIAKVI
jgi:glycosyltransferase family protein